MTPYKNLNGNSSVESYEYTENSILVVFKSGNWRNYLYDHLNPGRDVVVRMKALADQGYGLGSYIGKEVKGNYSKKW